MWEGFIKPRLVTRGLAEVLAADISLHAQSVAAELVQLRENPKLVPVHRPIPTQVFEAVIDRIGDLPRDLLGPTLGLYRVFERMNEMAARANIAFARIKEAEQTDPALQVIRARLNEEVALYGRFAENAKDRINVIQPLMIKAAMPWWSVRFWGSRKVGVVDTQKMARLATEMRTEHEARIRKLEADD
jgi:hypothetical protein